MSVKPLHSGPILPLAIMAIFAVMIPVISATNNARNTQAVNAMRLKLPTNEPVYRGPEVEMPAESTMPKQTPRATAYPSGKMPVMY
mgnify:CR=1 FL=1